MGLQNKDYPIYVTFDKGNLKAKVNGIDTTHGELTGMITGISVADDEYQDRKYKKLSVEITDQSNKQIYILQMSLAGGYGVSFCMMIPNIQYGLPVAISASEKTVEGKIKRTVFIKQGKWNVKWAFTKESPGELPPLKISKDKLNTVLYDSSDQQAYFILMIEELADLLSKKKGIERPARVAVNEPEQAETLPKDDLPF